MKSSFSLRVLNSLASEVIRKILNILDSTQSKNLEKVKIKLEQKILKIVNGTIPIKIRIKALKFKGLSVNTIIVGIRI
ncbi:MAG: hypothetical protein ACI976_000034 [Aureispira sp.]|jgi:hypothetical protein